MSMQVFESFGGGIRMVEDEKEGPLTLPFSHSLISSSIPLSPISYPLSPIPSFPSPLIHRGARGFRAPNNE